nr:unnamed protein product [Spirometra erinaceieuropaei]
MAPVALSSSSTVRLADGFLVNTGAQMSLRELRPGNQHGEDGVTHQAPPNTVLNALQISVDGSQLQVVDNLRYLDSTLARSTKIDCEVSRRISEVSQVFCRLQNTVWNRHGFQLSTKLKMYEAVMLPTMLYGAETLTVHMKQARRHNHFHLSGLRRILKESCMTGSQTRKYWGGRESSESTLCCNNYNYAREATLDDERLPKRPFYGDVAMGSCRQGGQVLRYKVTLKTSLKRLKASLANWGDLARDRPTWWRKVKTGAVIFAANRITVAKAKREAHKSQLPPPPYNANAQQRPTSPRCQRTFGAPSGLVGHLRTNFIPPDFTNCLLSVQISLASLAAS